MTNFVTYRNQHFKRQSYVMDGLCNEGGHEDWLLRPRQHGLVRTTKDNEKNGVISASRLKS